MSKTSKKLDLAQVLRDRRDHVVARFVGEVQRQDLSPTGVKRSLLVDHIPKFLDEIVSELERAEAVRPSQDAVATSPTAREHGDQRWDLGYDLEALIREYGVLRHCICEVAIAAGDDVSIRQMDILAKCLNVGVAEAAVAYVRHRDDQLEAEKAGRAFLMEAGQLLSSSLDYRSTLTRLTQLVVPRLADWCAIHVEDCGVDEMPIAHVDSSKVEMVRSVYRSYPLPADLTISAAHVMQTGAPQLLSVVDADLLDKAACSAEHLAMMRALKLGSAMIVPLRVQDSVFGAITFCRSDSGRPYTEADLSFAEELARRAAVAIDNAHLYQRSQEERSRVEAAIRAKDEFVAMVSHELRTPMNAILGWLTLLRTGTLSADRHGQALEIIDRNARAQNQLIADLLDISQVITGRVRINPAQVDLSGVVEMALAGIQPAADAKRLRIEADIDGGSVMRGDGDRLQQVIWNLLTNAVKFTPKDGVIRVQLRRVESNLELTVQDNGEGIDPTFMPHMFESFRQSDAGSTRQHGGLGIGLSIAKHLVELHGGSIEGRSEGKGKGATFVVRLPVSALVSTTMGVRKVATKNLSDRPPQPVLHGLRALIVEDDADALELLAFVLGEAGMEVRKATTANEARQVLSSYEPHVIVSDIGLPEEDGYALIRSIRTSQNESLRNVPAVALTAFASSSDRTTALVAGFNTHLTKPVDVSTLVTAIRELTGRSGPDQPAGG